MSTAAPAARRQAPARRDPYQLGPPSAWGTQGGQRVDRSGRGRPRIQADHHRLRLLDLPARRLHHVLGLLRCLRGARRGDGGRAHRRTAVRAQARRDRDGLPPALVVHLRAWLGCHGRQGDALDAGGAARHRAARLRLPNAGGDRVRRHGGKRRWAVAKRLPFRLLRAGWMPRAARQRRAAVARHDDGAAVVKGFRDDILRRLVCFNLFWHALDIIWVGVFTVVYLLGMGR